MIKIFVLVTSLALVGMLSGCNAPVGNEQITPHTEAVYDTYIAAASSNEIIVRGVVQSTLSRNVYSTLGLMVEHVNVEVGDRVYAGQVLATLDSYNLELNIKSQQAALDQARQNSQNGLSNSQRMLNEATANLSNNTNMQILNAQAALTSAEANLARLRKDYDAAVRDYESGSDMQVINARTALRNAEITSDNTERNYTQSRALYVLGAISADEMRRAEDERILAQNSYNNARISYENAASSQTRTLEQLRVSINQAIAAEQSAREMVRASRVAAEQDIARLRNNVSTAELSANLEHMELSLQMLERQLEDATITAPISGTVTAVIAAEGATPAAMGGLMFVVEDTDNLRVITRFREYDIGLITEGMEVSITSEVTGGEVYAGVINRINPAAVEGSPVVEFEVEIGILPLETSLRIGGTARVLVEF